MLIFKKEKNYLARFLSFKCDSYISVPCCCEALKLGWTKLGRIFRQRKGQDDLTEFFHLWFLKKNFLNSLQKLGWYKWGQWHVNGFTEVWFCFHWSEKQGCHWIQWNRMTSLINWKMASNYKGGEGLLNLVPPKGMQSAPKRMLVGWSWCSVILCVRVTGC